MTKISQLLSTWPAGVVGVQPWLQERHIYRQLSNHYVASGWLRKIGAGAYVRAGEKVTWQGGIYALQQGLKLPVHIGGLTALDIFGRSHFIPMGKHANVYIFSHDEQVPRDLPKWFMQLEQVSPYYIPGRLFDLQFGLTTFNYDNFAIELSTPERAFFEVLSLVPNQTSFEHACLLAQLQRTLRIDLVQKLLQECKSQTLKRLFLYMAREFDFYCLPHLKLEGVDLGSGPRRIGSGDMYDQKLNLYVPKMSSEVDPNQEVPDV